MNANTSSLLHRTNERMNGPGGTVVVPTYAVVPQKTARQGTKQQQSVVECVARYFLASLMNIIIGFL